MIESVLAALRDQFDLDGRLKSLPGELDQNFRLDTKDGAAFVVKLMRVGCDPALVEMQCAALLHLAERAPELSLPRVRPSVAGERVTSLRLDGEDIPRLLWVLSWIDGRMLAEVRPRDDDLLESLGRFLGRLDRALSDFDHPALDRELLWDISRAGWLGEELDAIADPDRRELVGRHAERFVTGISPRLSSLPASPIHNDANDWNVVVGADGSGNGSVRGLVDFGDLVRAPTICELAIACAYVMSDRQDPLLAAGRVVAGYHGERPLSDEELEILFDLIRTRLCVTVTVAAQRKQHSEDPYVTVSEAGAWSLLESLERAPAALAMFREACGLSPAAGHGAVTAWLAAQPDRCAPILGRPLTLENTHVFDLGVRSLLLGADPSNAATAPLTRTIFRVLEEQGRDVGVGRYGEARPLYTGPAFGAGHPSEERRTIHLGIDLFLPAGTALFAPLDGVVELVADNDAPQDYGPLLVLRHQTDAGEPFFTLYGHLDPSLLGQREPGQRVRRGEPIARIGAPPRNGDWPPHVHFQLVLDLLGLDADFPGVARPSERAIWQGLSPDPNLLLGIPAGCFPDEDPTPAALVERRVAALGPSLSLSYSRPLHIVRGWQQFLYDQEGRAYLDLYNNVPHVGHSHPRVVEATARQLALLNTNTRYLHDNAVRYAERLSALLPEPLSVCFFVNSGSEANELALRIARAHTRGHDVIVLAGGYHGHTSTLIDLSPYKFDGPGGEGRKSWVHVAGMADDYRGPHRRDDPDRGRKYAGIVGDLADRIAAAGRPPAAFLAESLPSVAGQIVFPPGYLEEAFRRVRAVGGVCIADEVQTGFGRIGSHRFAFEAQDVVPDLVVLGKPIGNGFPLAAVITTPEIALSFATGMEFFSTFGGNPVACAAGLAVLDVLEEEGLQARAAKTGERLLTGLHTLQAEHPLIGDVRGSGLFLGIELVLDRRTLEPAAEQAGLLVDRLREKGILAGTDGPLHNVVKLRGPMAVNERDADHFLAVLSDLLGEDRLRLD